METARDRQATIDPKTGLPATSPKSAARQVFLARALLVGGLLLPTGAALAYSSGWWSDIYEWRKSFREKITGLDPHRSHNEVLKFVYGDPTSIFYHDAKTVYQPDGRLPLLSEAAFAHLGEKQRTIQKIHDYWHTKYDDQIYRNVFKARLPDVLFDAYWDFLWSPEPFALPDAWVREIPPQKLWEFSSRIEERWQSQERSPSLWRILKFNMDDPQYYQYQYNTTPSGEAPYSPAWGDLSGDDVTSFFQGIGEVTPGQARTAPSMIETDPEE